MKPTVQRALKDIQSTVALAITKAPIMVVLIVLIWTAFFDEESLMRRHELGNRIEELEIERAELSERIEQDKRKISELENNKQLEKFAREEYFMKKENEVIFIIK